jgi:OsmC-like protein
MAACCSTIIALHAARLGIHLTALEVSVEEDADNHTFLSGDDDISAGYSAIQTTIAIATQNAPPEQLRNLAEWAQTHSPVACTVRDAPANTLRVVIT